MPSELIGLVANVEDYVCTWRDGELYIEPVPAQASTPERLAA
jgi:hypothetical protein